MTNFKVVSESIAGAPPITFEFIGDTFRASLVDAELHGELESKDMARMRLTSGIGEVLADISIHPRSHRTLTENVMDIGSALLWSHWRHATAGAAT